MCRNIKKLRNPERPPTDDEIALAALQFVRKVSGYQKPSRVNEAAFEDAITEVAAATRKLLDQLYSKTSWSLSQEAQVDALPQRTINGAN